MNFTFAKYLVCIASIYNASALIVFLTPGGLAFFGVREPYSPFWTWLPALLALFASIVLFLSSLDLHKYGTFPYYNGIIRVLFASAAFLLGFQNSVGLFIGLIAAGDMIIGLLCIFSIPRALNKTHIALLLNQD